MFQVKQGFASSSILSLTAIILSGLALLVATGILDVKEPVSAEFETQARDYLLENPEIVVEALQLLEDRKQRAELSELQAMIATRYNDIFLNTGDPIGGNADGDVTLVEFFDYNCPYCRKAAPTLKQAMDTDGKLKLVYKEWPILGPASVFAAKAALASKKQGKYAAYHEALMTYSGSINEAVTLTVAKQVGLDIDQLKLDMQDPAILDLITRNAKLASGLRITGTPTFVIGEKIIRGLVDLSALQGFIAEAREPRQE